MSGSILVFVLPISERTSDKLAGDDRTHDFVMNTEKYSGVSNVKSTFKAQKSSHLKSVN